MVICKQLWVILVLLFNLLKASVISNYEKFKIVEKIISINPNVHGIASAIEVNEKFLNLDKIIVLQTIAISLLESRNLDVTTYKAIITLNLFCHTGANEYFLTYLQNNIRHIKTLRQLSLECEDLQSYLLIINMLWTENLQVEREKFMNFFILKIEKIKSNVDQFSSLIIHLLKICDFFDLLEDIKSRHIIIILEFLRAENEDLSILCLKLLNATKCKIEDIVYLIQPCHISNLLVLKKFDDSGSTSYKQIISGSLLKYPTQFYDLTRNDFPVFYRMVELKDRNVLKDTLLKIYVHMKTKCDFPLNYFDVSLIILRIETLTRNFSIPLCPIDKSLLVTAKNYYSGGILKSVFLSKKFPLIFCDIYQSLIKVGLQIVLADDKLIQRTINDLKSFKITKICYNICYITRFLDYKTIFNFFFLVLKNVYISDPVLEELKKLSQNFPEANFFPISTSVSDSQTINYLIKTIKNCKNENQVEKIFNSQLCKIRFNQILLTINNYNNYNALEPILACCYLFEVKDLSNINFENIEIKLIDLKVKTKYFLEKILEKYSSFNSEFPLTIDIGYYIFSLVEKDKITIYQLCLQIYKEYSNLNYDKQLLQRKVFKFLNSPIVKVEFDFDSFFNMIYKLLGTLKGRKNLFQLSKTL